jgi:hypothetical protein
MFTYFVFYSHKTHKGKIRPDRCEISRDEKITDLKDIQEIEKIIEIRYLLRNVVVSNFIELDSASESGPTDLENICLAYDQCGIEYTIRARNEYTYLFIGNGKKAYSYYGGEPLTLAEGNLDSLLGRAKYFEFENGNLVSYS